MDPVNLKFEGNGNGLKTIILNLEDIASSLNKDPIMLITYLSVRNGCKYIAGNNTGNIKWTLNGRYTQDTIQNYIYEFIEYFVLCKHCRIPETVFHLESKKDNAKIKCSACSKQSDIIYNSHTEKVIKLIK
jgi:translation initiation factor 5